tara:strand:+ start:376 stop:966 length:591 start_codon:yes stop_codon:yes gene_type:complete
MRSISGFNGSSINGSFAAGESISASALNKLATGIGQAQTMPSNDVQFMGNTGGTSYALPQQVYYASTGNPLDPTLSGDKVTIQPGTVNRYIPKIGANYIDETPRPTLTVTDTGYVLVKCTYEVNKFFPRTAEIVFLAVPTPPADTDTESFYPLGKVTKTVVDSVTTYSLQTFQNGNLAVNRLKAGANIATWWWTRV